MTSKLKRRVAKVLAGAAVAGALACVDTESAMASLVMDLRFAPLASQPAGTTFASGAFDSGMRNLDLTKVTGSSVTVQVWAQLTGTNATEDEAIMYVRGAVGQASGGSALTGAGVSSFSLNSNFYSTITNNSAGSANGSGWGDATTVGNAIYGVLNDNLANVSAATLTAAGQASNTTWRPLSSPTGDEFLFGTFNVSLGTIAGAGASDKITSYQWVVPSWNNGGSHNSKTNAWAQFSMDAGAFKYPQGGGTAGGAYDPINYPAPASGNFVNFLVPHSAANETFNAGFGAAQPTDHTSYGSLTPAGQDGYIHAGPLTVNAAKGTVSIVGLSPYSQDNRNKWVYALLWLNQPASDAIKTALTNSFLQQNFGGASWPNSNYGDAPSYIHVYDNPSQDYGWVFMTQKDPSLLTNPPTYMIRFDAMQMYVDTGKDFNFQYFNWNFDSTVPGLSLNALSVVSVPEPSTLLMGMLGLGMVGALNLRARRNRK